MVSTGETSIAFENDLPLPEINVILYRKIYVLEQWLRRIALAALTARYGTQWHGAIPTQTSANLKVRVGALRNRVAFDTENSDNAIWCLTLDELKALLVYDKVWPTVKALTGFDRQELSARIEDLREIRNVVGHNRAATDYTGKVFDAIDHVLEGGIRVFRDRLLYDFEGRQTAALSNRDPVVSSFYESRSPLGPAQLTADEHFYYIHYVPRAHVGPLALGDLLEHFDPVRRIILAFLVNRQSLGEYSLVWPKAAASNENDDVLKLFNSFQPADGMDYRSQNPKYVCHPKVWFVF